MKLVIDVGNTQIKTAVFKEDVLVEFERILPHHFIEKMESILFNYSIEAILVAAVGNLEPMQQQYLQKLPTRLVEVSANINLPFQNRYKTPKTLGVDRIALASAAVQQFPAQHVLILDAGTCLTYDFVNNQAQYLGGAISPGVQSRYKALHQFTQKLPLLEKQNIDYLTGYSTETSIHSGVVNGLVCEIEGIIAQYTAVYKKLTVVLTGGDAEFLAKQLKNSIFVAPYFLVEGLNAILKLNIHD